MKAPFALFVFDLDGTALGGYEPYARFPDRFSELLDELAALQVRWATNTTWGPGGQAELIRASAVESRPAMTIGRTGLMWATFATDGRALISDEKREQEARDLGERYLSQFVPALEAFCRQELGRECELGHLADEPLMRTVEPTDGFPVDFVERLREFVSRDGWAYCRPSASERVVEVLPCDMSKGEALRKLQQELGVPAESTLVAGDWTNDLPMFDVALARYQVCPANATEQVKKRVAANSGIVAERPFSDGVVDAVRRVIASGARLPAPRTS